MVGMTEIWKPVPEFAYEISDLGRLRRRGRIIAPKVTRHGYWHYCLWRDGKPNWRLAHRLVHEVHIGPIGDGLEINHLDGDKVNNKVSNLEAVTKSENALHRHRVLGVKTNFRAMNGTENGSAKLSEAQVHQLRADRRAEGISYAKLADRYGITPTMAWLIVKRKAWGHI
jgi:hypothetical protein